jgi:hypothetical protein
VAVWIRRPAVAPIAGPAAVGLLVAGIAVALTVHLTAMRYGGNVSGLVMISPDYFDRNPVVLGRDDIRQSLSFSPGGGYDGQFLYFMTFDPWLTAFRDDPRQYKEFIDYPPYRYGRIGFSVLAKIASANQAVWYPLAMVTIVIVSLGACGALLATIAQRFGLSALYGLLAILVPGFWQSVKSVLPEPLAIALILAAYWTLTREKWIVAGVLLGLSMLMRETGGVFVLAMLGGLLLAGKRREAIVTGLLAFVPVLMWKAFVGWVFWPEYGLAGVLPRPDDAGWPFAGLWDMWSMIAHGRYFPDLPQFARAGILFSALTLAALCFAVLAAIRRPGPMTVAAALYALLTICFNYGAVWLHVGNADRLTVELFVALALVTLETARDRGRISTRWAIFWSAAACYVFFGAYESAILRDSLWGLI